MKDGEEKGFTAEEFQKAKLEGWEKQFKFIDGKKKVWLPGSVGNERELKRVNRTPKTSQYGRKNPTVEYWNSDERVPEWRKSWEDCVNKKFEELEKDIHIDSRSYEAQGLDRLPTVHMGPAAINIERKADREVREGASENDVIRSDIGDINRDIKKYNNWLLLAKAMLESKISKLKSAIESVAPTATHKVNEVEEFIDTDILKAYSPKRMSPITLFKIKAGISLEAAIAVPILVFFLVNIISFINIYDNYSVALSEVQQQARRSSFENHDINSDERMVTVTKEIPLNSFFSFMGFGGELALVSISYRSWTGYDLINANNYIEEDEYVYVTEHGNSYHRNRNCKHLRVKIEVLNIDEIHLKRNSGGAKYKPCERCGGNSTGVVFYTPDGNKYHAIANCSGLKRTIVTIKMSEVGSRRECKDCGK